MSNISCEVIRDLLPLYIDDVCSKKSHALVAEHLLECEECRKIYDDMKSELPKVLSPEEIDSVDELKAFLKDVGKTTEKMARELAKRITIKQIILICVAVFFVFVIHYLKTNEDFIPPEFINVKETYELNNGDLCLLVESEVPITNAYCDMGESHAPMDRNNDNATLNTYYYTQFWRFWDSSLPKEILVVFDADTPVSGINEYTGEIYTNEYYRTVYYYYGDTIIWEYDADREYKEAPKEIEKKIQDQVKAFKENPQKHFEDYEVIFDPHSWNEYYGYTNSAE